jgi:uncharacterized protein (DUF488 family)
VKKKPIVFTIGHSTREFDEFVDLLRAYGITYLVDVRTIPRSRRNPQFNKETLSKEPPELGIRYTHMKGLGGLRHPHKNSKNLGWRNASFRGYADYMQTIDFEDNLERLIQLIRKNRKGNVAYMCAEALPWSCHRSLISDALAIRGFQVEHIMTGAKTYEHKITRFAKISRTRITYPVQAGGARLSS